MYLREKLTSFANGAQFLFGGFVEVDRIPACVGARFDCPGHNRIGRGLMIGNRVLHTRSFAYGVGPMRVTNLASSRCPTLSGASLRGLRVVRTRASASGAGW